MRKNMKFISLIILVGLLSTIILGCSSEPDTVDGDALFKPGTYTGETDGHNGPIKVNVTVDEETIKEIEIVEHEESEGIADAALERIPENIIEGQTLAVDVVTGATYTSDAILLAVEKALEEAGADIDALKEESEKASAGDTITYDTEVIVVGGGAAGLSAALEAANTGAEVVLLEKLPMTGGSTARSGGKILAAGTDVQKSHGVEDNADLYYEYLIDRGEGKINADKARIVADTSLENFNWLVENGVEFSKDIEELHETRRPIRGHYVSAQDGKEEQDGHGWAITQPLEEKAREAGVEVLLETPVHKLITNDEGHVTGVEATNADGENIIVNGGSVILATGGYDLNPELLEEYAPLVQPVHSTVAVGNVGDGLIMAKELDAEIEANGGAILLYLDLAAGLDEPRGLYVDTTGSRFMDESEFWFTRSKKLIERDETGMFYITDENGKLDSFDALVEAGQIIKGDSIEELEENLAMTELTSTVERYNELAEAGNDEDFNKPAEYMVSVEEGSFYAVPFLPVTSGTFGGPLTNEKAQVISKSGDIINGLYAAGEVANGDFFYQEYPGSGTSISMCIAFGRISGKEAAEEAISQR